MLNVRFKFSRVRACRFWQGPAYHGVRRPPCPSIQGVRVGWAGNGRKQTAGAAARHYTIAIP